MPVPLDAAFEAGTAERGVFPPIEAGSKTPAIGDFGITDNFDWLQSQLRSLQAKGDQNRNSGSSNASIRTTDLSESWTPGLTATPYSLPSARDSGLVTPRDAYLPRGNKNPKSLKINVIAPSDDPFSDEARAESPLPSARLSRGRSSTSSWEPDYNDFPRPRTRSASTSRSEHVVPAFARAGPPRSPGTPGVHDAFLGQNNVAYNWFPGKTSPTTLTLPSLLPATVPAAEEKQEESDTDNEKRDSESDATVQVEKPKRGLWQRFVDEFRCNYCPREAPVLILPTSPSDKEKYSYVNAGRSFLVACDLISTGALAVGAWFFIKADWVFVWYALYAAYSEMFTLTSLIITIFGSSFDLKKHKKIIEENPLDETAPTVDVFLPVCKEPLEILENTWTHIAAMDYPKGKMKTFILDDGAQDDVKALCERFNFTYVLRPNRGELKKAGNLRYGFSQTSGDFFAIFDADFCPRTDFLSELIPVFMDDKKAAIVQSPQYFRSTGNQSWIEQGAGATQEYFYRMIQTCRNRWGGSICVGSNAVYRREALEEVGGTAPVEHSEDMETGFFATTRGWSVQYRPLVLACGVCPDSPRAFFVQQMRWCNGSLHMLTRRDFWTSNLTIMQKFCYATGVLCYYSSASACIFTPLPAIVILWARPDAMRYYNLFFAFPAVLIGLIAMRFWARARYTMSVQYAQAIMAYAHLQAVWDQVFGQTLQWVPSGDTKLAKAKKRDRYGNMRMLAWGWTIALNTLLITGATVRIIQGLAWYQCVPALFLDAYNLLIIHRFLLYRHVKE